jgi:hypothetical protein
MNQEVLCPESQFKTEISFHSYYLPRDFWPSSVNQKTISDFWDLNPGPNSLLAIVAVTPPLPRHLHEEP